MLPIVILRRGCIHIMHNEISVCNIQRHPSNCVALSYIFGAVWRRKISQYFPRYARNISALKRDPISTQAAFSQQPVLITMGVNYQTKPNSHAIGFLLRVSHHRDTDTKCIFSANFVYTTHVLCNFTHLF